jgi:hypothetical protein
MLIMGLVGDVDTTTVDGYAYNLKNYASTLLQQGLISSYYTSITAPYAKAIRNSSSTNKDGLSAVAQWFANNYIYVIVGVGGGILLIISAVVVKKCCFTPVKPVPIPAATKEPILINARSRRNSASTLLRMSTQGYINSTRPNSANNTMPNTPQRRLSIETSPVHSPVHIVEMMDMMDSSPPPYTVRFETPRSIDSSRQSTPAQSNRRLLHSSQIDTQTSTVDNSPVPYRSRFSHQNINPIPFNIVDTATSNSEIITNTDIQPPSLSSQWIEYTTSDGRPYWFNAELGETKWSDPKTELQ